MRLSILLALSACSQRSLPELDAHPLPLDHAAFNQAAVEQAVPLYQLADGQIHTYRTRLDWSHDVEAAAQAVRDSARHTISLDARHQALRSELAAGRITLLSTRDVPAADVAMIRALLTAGDQVEELYWLQTGVTDLRSTLPASDPLAHAVFNRNQGPWCESPDQASNGACTATLQPAPRISGLYPASAQQGDDWCDAIPNDAMSPFVVAVEGENGLVAMPYTERWPTQMGAVADTLLAAAEAAADDEAALATYLRAAAAAFRSNDWATADAAWAEMNQDNSRYYLRIGPDETYFDPCNQHAGFHMSLARVNTGGLRYQELLSPLKQQLEHELATLAGAPYTERQVGFDLPEFIEVMVNTGDSRSAIGATIGQSLPNWGPVADAGGRTVAMTNIGTDADSIASSERALSAILCPTTHAAWPRDPEPLLFSTVLHEAAHNLGPSHEYAVNGKTDVQAFGGPLAQMLEELKAQTAALVLPLWLAHNGYVDADRLYPTQVADIAWAFGHIASGMSDGAGNPQPYSHLAAIQVGYFLDNGGMDYQAETLAANGTDRGCFEVDADNLPDAIDGLARRVLRIKAAGDRTDAQALRDQYTSDGTAFAELRATVAQRLRREPKNSYVYRVELPE